MTQRRPTASVPLVHFLVIGALVVVTTVYTLSGTPSLFGPPGLLALLAYLCYLVYRGVRAIEYEAFE
ncbi:hypothetical protein Halru_0016 [Halovivax ruber XH-70]|uniref:Uncharacterized protein n=1 Tax=Halovivax ruber (strain DSM 18193 / JCM 13892 / XH-70) TaxID=797302 RepID=L0I8U8_HALRX|nr:hypothetical protein [Halovivax ruber]AGB14671.1 hypothetical protein Halru_0016 [Halovivax ruber XH-70]